MSQLTHPRTQFVDLKFRARTWLVALAAIVVLAVPTALIVSSGDDSATTNQASANGQLRYDGGPNEGTRGISAQAASQPSNGQLRYDGGPNEGTRGISAQAVSQPSNGQLRYDGGPNEGTRGISVQPASQPSSESSSDVFGLRP